MDKVQSISEQQGRQATASQTSVSYTTTCTQAKAAFKVYNEISIKSHRNYPCPDLATHLHPMRKGRKGRTGQSRGSRGSTLALIYNKAASIKLHGSNSPMAS